MQARDCPGQAQRSTNSISNSIEQRYCPDNSAYFLIFDNSNLLINAQNASPIVAFTSSLWTILMSRSDVLWLHAHVCNSCVEASVGGNVWVQQAFKSKGLI